MNWLRGKLRAWLGIDNHPTRAELNLEVGALRAQLDSLKTELDSFKSALKAKAAESRPKQVYTDYESSQQAVLAEFEEKNGVRS